MEINKIKNYDEKKESFMLYLENAITLDLKMIPINEVVNNIDKSIDSFVKSLIKEL